MILRKLSRSPLISLDDSKTFRVSPFICSIHRPVYEIRLIYATVGMHVIKKFTWTSKKQDWGKKFLTYVQITRTFKCLLVYLDRYYVLFSAVFFLNLYYYYLENKN